MFPGLHVASKISRPTEYTFYWGKSVQPIFVFNTRPLATMQAGVKERDGMYDFYLNLHRGTVMRRRIGNLMHVG